MNISGIVVTALPAHVPQVARALATLPLTDVTQIDEASGRIVVVQERASVGQEFDGLRAIQRLPHVLAADLVMHYFGEDEQPKALAAEEIAQRLETSLVGAGHGPCRALAATPESEETNPTKSSMRSPS